MSKLIFKDGSNLVIADLATAQQLFDEIFIYENYRLPKTLKQKIIVDIGANVGFFTLYSRQKIPNAEIFAIEADPNNYKILKENIRVNPIISNVRLFNFAIFGNEAKTSFFCNAISGWSSLFPTPEAEEIKVNTISFSKFCNINKIKHIDFLKIDVEGAEYDIILNDKDFFSILIKEIYLEIDNKPRDKRYNVSDLIDKLHDNYYLVKVIKKKDNGLSLVHCKLPKYF
jgi:FkbM family methyltransferase